MNGQQHNQSNTGMVIDKKIDAMVHDLEAKRLSSNPNDYINGSKDYYEILILRDDALRYMLKSLEISQEDGLKEYIMASACSVLLQEYPLDRKWSTGKEWYKGYILQRKEGASGGSNQEIADFDHICGVFAYPFTWPKVEILNDNHRIYWDKGDANFTGRAGEITGNTCFGMNEEWVDKLKSNIVRPESKLVFKVAEVQGLNTPRLMLQRFNQDNSTSPYLLHQNTMISPKEDGEYILILTVDWGNGDNTILYWFKLKVADN
ncbi:MAG: hypothetical protein U9N81_13255 [Bacillota bacterium]|nr:hypothetical protein [Bacillota bacterium]